MNLMCQPSRVPDSGQVGVWWVRRRKRPKDTSERAAREVISAGCWGVPGRTENRLMGLHNSAHLLSRHCWSVALTGGNTTHAGFEGFSHPSLYLKHKEQVFSWSVSAAEFCTSFLEAQICSGVLLSKGNSCGCRMWHVQALFVPL